MPDSPRNRLTDLLGVDANSFAARRVGFANSEFPGIARELGIQGTTSQQENIPRLLAQTNLTTVLATAVATSVSVHLPAGFVATNIAFRTGTQATVTPANWWVALYSSAATPALLAQSADQTTTAMAANTTFSLALATAQTITTAGMYTVSIMVKAATVPDLVGALLNHLDLSTGLITGSSLLSQTNGSALAATAPATVTGGTATAKVPYVVLS